jgi:hypothetical protein
MADRTAPKPKYWKVYETKGSSPYLIFKVTSVTQIRTYLAQRSTIEHATPDDLVHANPSDIIDLTQPQATIDQQ